MAYSLIVHRWFIPVQLVTSDTFDRIVTKEQRILHANYVRRGTRTDDAVSPCQGTVAWKHAL